MLGQGLDGADAVIGVPNGKFKVTKCSWLQMMRRNSSLSVAPLIASALSLICNSFDMTNGCMCLECNCTLYREIKHASFKFKYR